MIATDFRIRFVSCAWSIAGAIALLACGSSALAQTKTESPSFLEHDAETPPMLFREIWQQPPHAGPLISSPPSQALGLKK